MSLIFKTDIIPKGVAGVWHNTEGDEFFEQELILFGEEKEELKTLKARKRSEWLSSRYLLHLLSERVIRGACLKDQYGKPYLKDSDYHISISHSSEYTAVIAAPVSVGVDIQVIVPKINRIAPRFVRDDEFINIPEDEHTHYFHAIWGAKESMYKSYGKKELDFKTHMKVSAFTYVKEGCFFEGEIIKGHYYQKYLLFCKQIQNLILVYALEQ